MELPQQVESIIHEEYIEGIEEVAKFILIKDFEPFLREVLINFQKWLQSLDIERKSFNTFEMIAKDYLKENTLK